MFNPKDIKTYPRDCEKAKLILRFRNVKHDNRLILARVIGEYLIASYYSDHCLQTIYAPKTLSFSQINIVKIIISKVLPRAEQHVW